MLVFVTRIGASATSCDWGATAVSDVITDRTEVFKGTPVYFSQKTKPGSEYGWSTVFKIDELYKGKIGGYGNYKKIFHYSRINNTGLPFQIGDTYFIIAQTQENGDLVTQVGPCGVGFGKDDILEYIKTGNPDNAINQTCRNDIRRAFLSEFIDGKFTLFEKKCSRYVPAFKREYPDFVKKYAREK